MSRSLRRPGVAVALQMLAVGLGGWRDAGALEVQGSARVGAGAGWAVETPSPAAPSVDSRWAFAGFRVDLRQALGDAVRLDVAYAGHLRRGDESTAFVAEALEESSTRGFRIADLGSREYTGLAGRSLQYRQNLDRLALRMKFNDFDLDVGRQAITWGVARSIRPLEFITQNQLSSLGADERNGVDAVRVRMPTDNGLGEIDGGVVFGRDLRADRSAAYLRRLAVVEGWELTGVAGKFLGNGVAGVGAYTSLYDIGVRMEFVHVDARGFAGEGTRSYSRGTLGFDYALNRDSYAFVEFHHNGAGAPSASLVPRLQVSEGYQSQSLLLLRRHYAVAGLRYQPSPAVNMNVYAIGGLDDRSAIFSAALHYNFDEDWYLGAEATVGTGPRLTEFRRYGRTLRVSLIRYF